MQDNGKKVEQESRGPEQQLEKEGSVEAEDRDKKIISSEEEAKARIAEKRREMKVCFLTINFGWDFNFLILVFISCKKGFWLQPKIMHTKNFYIKKILLT